MALGLDAQLRSGSMRPAFDRRNGNGGTRAAVSAEFGPMAEQNGPLTSKRQAGDCIRMDAGIGPGARPSLHGEPRTGPTLWSLAWHPMRMTLEQADGDHARGERHRRVLTTTSRGSPMSYSCRSNRARSAGSRRTRTWLPASSSCRSTTSPCWYSHARRAPSCGGMA